MAKFTALRLLHWRNGKWCGLHLIYFEHHEPLTPRNFSRVDADKKEVIELGETYVLKFQVLNSKGEVIREDEAKLTFGNDTEAINIPQVMVAVGNSLLFTRP